MWFSTQTVTNQVKRVPWLHPAPDALKDGYVACTPLGKSRHVVEVFGDVRFEEDLVAVRKQSCLLPFGGLDGGDDPAALYSNGNNLSLVNTQVNRVGLKFPRQRRGGHVGRGGNTKNLLPTTGPWTSVPDWLLSLNSNPFHKKGLVRGVPGIAVVKQTLFNSGTAS